MKVEASDVDTKISFGIWGFNSTTPWAEEPIFTHFTDGPSISINGSDKTDIELDFGEMMN